MKFFVPLRATLSHNALTEWRTAWRDHQGVVIWKPRANVAGATAMAPATNANVLKRIVSARAARQDGSRTVRTP